MRGGRIKVPEGMSWKKNNSDSSGIKDKSHQSKKVQVLIVVISAAGGLNRHCSSTIVTFKIPQQKIYHKYWLVRFICTYVVCEGLSALFHWKKGQIWRETLTSKATDPSSFQLIWFPLNEAEVFKGNFSSVRLDHWLHGWPLDMLKMFQVSPSRQHQDVLFFFRLFSSRNKLTAVLPGICYYLSARPKSPAGPFPVLLCNSRAQLEHLLLGSFPMKLITPNAR